MPLIFAESGLIDRVGMKFFIVICRTKYLFWNPQIESVRNSKSCLTRLTARSWISISDKQYFHRYSLPPDNRSMVLDLKN